VIKVDTSLFGTPGGIPVGSQAIGLHNPFKPNDQNLSSLTKLTTNEGIQQAYQWWLEAQIKLENPAVIRGLDMIAWAAIDAEAAGKDLVLNCPCNTKQWCHGYVVKRIIEKKLKEINNG
jgi:hypothetical protein